MPLLVAHPEIRKKPKSIRASETHRLLNKKLFVEADKLESISRILFFTERIKIYLCKKGLLSPHPAAAARDVVYLHIRGDDSRIKL